MKVLQSHTAMTADRKSQSRLFGNPSHLETYSIEGKKSLGQLPPRTNSSSNTLRERVSMLRAQAAVNMKAADMKVP